MKNTINIEKTYPYSQEEVWNALVDQELLSEWLMKTDLVPKVGHKFTFDMGKPNPPFRGNVRCEVLAVEKPRLLKYTWDVVDNQPVQTVTWKLEKISSGTKLTLEHTGFVAGQEQIFDATDSGWTKKLDSMIGASIEKRQLAKV